MESIEVLHKIKEINGRIAKNTPPQSKPQIKEIIQYFREIDLLLLEYKSNEIKLNYSVLVDISTRNDDIIEQFWKSLQGSRMPFPLCVICLALAIEMFYLGIKSPSIKTLKLLQQCLCTDDQSGVLDTDSLYSINNLHFNLPELESVCKCMLNKYVDFGLTITDPLILESAMLRAHYLKELTDLVFIEHK